jgi:hypothetical protein
MNIGKESPGPATYNGIPDNIWNKSKKILLQYKIYKRNFGL